MTTAIATTADARPRVVPEDPSLREAFLRAYRAWLRSRAVERR